MLQVRCALLCLLLLAGMWPCPTRAGASDWNTTFAGLGGPTGPVGPMAIWDDGGGEALYAGAGTNAGLGLFTSAGGLSAGFIARWNGVGWSPLGKGLDGAPAALVGFGEMLVAGGSFTRAGDVPVSGVAAWDGKRWRALGTEIGSVGALLVHQGQLYAAGGMNSTSAVARWDGQRWVQLGAGMNQPVRALAVYQGQLVAAGWFSQIGATPVRQVARWDGSSWTQVGDGLTGMLNVLAVHQGELVAAGSSAVTTGQSRLARFDGQAWQPYNLPFAAQALASYNGQLLAGVSAVVGGLVSVDSQGWQVFSGGTDAMARGLLAHGDRLYVAGAFGRAGSILANRIAAHDAQGWHALGTGLDGPVLDYAQFGGELVVAGRFRGAGGILSPGVLRWDGSRWAGFGADGADEVHALAVHAGSLHAAGPWSDGNGFHTARVRHWDGQQWQQRGALRGSIGDLVSFGNLLVVAGGFDFVDSLPVDDVAAWDGQQWLALGTSPFVQFTRLIVHDSQLIGFGQASTPGVSAARWDGQSWVPMGNNLDLFPTAATVHANELYVGGESGSARLRRWSGSNWEPVDGLDFNVRALVSHDGSLLAAGSRPDGSAVSVMRRVASAWEPVGAAVDLGFASLGVHGGRLLAGGNFSRFGQRVLPFLAAYGPALDSATAIVAATPAAVTAGTPVELRVEVSAQAAPTAGHVTITASPGGSCTDAELEPQDASTSVARCTITWATACTRELVADYVGATDGTQVWQSSRSAPVLLEVGGAPACTDNVLFDSGFE